MKKTLPFAIAIMLTIPGFEIGEVQFHDFNKTFHQGTVDVLAMGSEERARFGFCEILSSGYPNLSGWDSIIVVPPYIGMSMLPSMGFDNFWSVGRAVGSFTYNDGLNTLLFVKGRRIIGYGTLYQVPINVNYDLYKSQQNTLPIIRKEDCQSIYLERRSYGGQTIYVLAKGKH